MKIRVPGIPEQTPGNTVAQQQGAGCLEGQKNSGRGLLKLRFEFAGESTGGCCGKRRRHPALLSFQPGRPLIQEFSCKERLQCDGISLGSMVAAKLEP